MSLPRLPEYALSHSAIRRIEECPRAHYLHTWGGWGGWERESAQREVYVLTKAKTIPQRAGSLVHEAAARCLTAIRMRRAVPEADALVADALADLGRSVDRKADADLKRIPPLVEVLYADPGLETKLRDAANSIERSIQALTTGRYLARIGEQLGGSLRVVTTEALDTLRVEDPRLPAALKVWVAMDVLARIVEPPMRVVVDWKAGQQRDTDTEQLGVYALQVAGHGVPVVLALVYLRDDEVRLVEADAAIMHEARERLVEAGVDLASRVTLTEERGVTIMDTTPEQWPLTEDRRTCARCAYRRICGR